MSAILTRENDWAPPPKEVNPFRRNLSPLASQICDRLEISHFLDYFCGDDPIMLHLKSKQKLKIQCFDPLIPRFEALPVPSEFVFCALNEADFDFQTFETLIADLKRVTLTACLFAVEKTDRPCEWWARALMEHFEMQTFQRLQSGFYVIFYNSQEKLVLAS